VVFVDAAASGDAPYELRPLAPAADASTPVTVSRRQRCSTPTPAHRREPPPARLLAIRGHEFALGAPLSRAAAANLRAALTALTMDLREALARAGGQPLPA